MVVIYMGPRMHRVDLDELVDRTTKTRQSFINIENERRELQHLVPNPAVALFGSQKQAWKKLLETRNPGEEMYITSLYWDYDIKVTKDSEIFLVEKPRVRD